MPQKYEREIDEILRRLDDGPARPATGPRAVPTLERVQPARIVPIRRWRGPQINASALMIAALALAVLSAPMQYVYAPAVAYVGLAAVGLMLGSLALSIGRWRRGRPTPTWRGRPIEVERGFSLAALRRRWSRWRTRRRFRDPRWN